MSTSTGTFTTTSLSPEYTSIALRAVRPVPGKSPFGRQSAAKTPSINSIVEAFNKDGQGDREMLLALLQAKAKEDERLAALDNLQAEQLRAYSSHLAVFGSASGAHLQPLHIPYQQSQYPMHRDLSRSPALTSRSSDDGAEEEQPKTPVEPTEPSASSLSSHKRKRSTQEEGAFDSARRISPAFSAADRTPLLPSTASQPTPPQSLRRSISPSSSSLRHLLNEELRPFSNGRARTSEMRTSASDEDEE